MYVRKSKAGKGAQPTFPFGNIIPQQRKVFSAAFDQFVVKPGNDVLFGGPVEDLIEDAVGPFYMLAAVASQGGSSCLLLVGSWE